MDLGREREDLAFAQMALREQAAEPRYVEVHPTPGERTREGPVGAERQGRRVDEGLTMSSPITRILDVERVVGGGLE